VSGPVANVSGKTSPPQADRSALAALPASFSRAFVKSKKSSNGLAFASRSVSAGRPNRSSMKAMMLV